ncbi:MAG: hypothetical protein UT02_C0019G0005 [Parcubacteria group bacterium GW2011_GWC2_38_7]|nr:MAG: hypothetical protein UT02_C0019G0005 [Parcubacteria group bacterium GW2011_GWC2_38_7]
MATKIMARVEGEELYLKDYSLLGNRSGVTDSIQPGTYELEKIPFPFTEGSSRPDWFVLKGTTIGGACGYWRQFNDPRLRVTITETPEQTQGGSDA